MSRISLFNSPLLLGFEHFEQALDRISKTASDGYPPYDVAVAGFTLDDLQVQIEDNQLVIHGRRHEEAQRAFLHRGIAARQFHRNFVLAEGIEVSGASLVNGLLHIDLERPISEPTVKKIEVVAGPGESTGARIDGMEKEE
jgi:HSP20 family molecular chaperone IbpA